MGGVNDHNQYLEWDFGSPKWVTEVHTEGRAPNPAQWVTRFSLAFVANPHNRSVWTPVTNANGTPAEFEGNKDKNTEKVNKLPGFLAQKVRLYPIAWHSAISMRA